MTRLTGVIHLPPLPGSPLAARAIDDIARACLTDARALREAGFDLAIVENFGDAPFFRGRVPAITVSAMTACAMAAKEAGIALGVNVLRNDPRSAIAIAVATGADAVRVNVHTGARVTDQGLIEGEAAETLRERRALGAKIAIWADVDVKHSAPLAARAVEDEARDLVTRALADAVLVTGEGTGRAVDLVKLARVRAATKGVPLFVASGATEASLAALAQHADGVIVGSALRADGVAGGPVDAARAGSFARAFRAAFGVIACALDAGRGRGHALAREADVAFIAEYNDLGSLVSEASKRHEELNLFAFEREGRIVHRTYGDVARESRRRAADLARRGVGRGDLVAVISGNRPEWLEIAHAAHRVGAALVPMYEAQLERDWRYILADANAKVCFCAEAALERVRAFALAGLEVLPLDAPRGDRGEEGGADASAPDDLALVIYTSGTTGSPKGVELTHRSLAFVVSALHEAARFESGGRTVSILPWAHVGGAGELFASVNVGTTIAIASSVERIFPVIQATKPTRIVGVPRVWNRFYDAIQKNIARAPLPVRGVFKAGLEASIKRRAGEPLSLRERAVLALAERLVFPKVRARLGGELKTAIPGAAALSVDVARFVDALGIELLEAYGLTEVSAVATMNRPGRARVGTVGVALPGVELRIDGEGEGGGEVLIKSPGAMRGYRGLPDETRAATDGVWVRTGDLGRIDADGYLRITGRVREVYKLENGKFVSPAPIEERLTTSPYIAQALVHGLNRPFNVALLVADVVAVKAWSAAHGVGELDVRALLGSTKVQGLLAAEIRALNEGFKGYERVERFHVVAEQFSLDNDMLTPSMKVKRRRVLEKWGSDLEKLYAASAKLSAGSGMRS